MFGDDSDYFVEQYIKPTKVAVPLINDERADILGNFDDDDSKFNKKKKGKKRKEVISVSEENPFAEEENDNDDQPGENCEENEMAVNEKNSEGNDDEEMPEENLSSKEDASELESEPEAANGNESEPDQGAEPSSDNEEKPKIAPKRKLNEKSQQKSKNKKVKSADATKPATAKETDKKVELSDDQMKALIRGSCKQDRYVLYVTNLNYSTSRDKLTDFFSAAGSVKSVRIPKVRRSAFAFIEMDDLASFKNALALHNRTLDNYTIKVQISEGGKKKSANKKNILKQKNRKLAEMRNEGKQFSRSGKGYDKTIKKEIHQRKLQQDRRLAKKAARKHAK